VLLVDDFPLVREGMTAALESDPAIRVVGEAGDGLEGVKRALELRPDVVIVDIRMPGSSGIVLLERLRDELPDTRVLVVTASEKSQTLLYAIAAGADGYLTKRVRRKELCRAVITVHGGGAVVAPELATELLREYAKASHGDGLHAQPLLSARESGVLQLLSQGLTDREIGEHLYVSPRTVQNHLARIRAKTGLGRRSEMARWAAEHMIA
jgi:DNA-binding NarL/FixJ family response regulator